MAHRLLAIERKRRGIAAREQRSARDALELEQARFQLRPSGCGEAAGLPFRSEDAVTGDCEQQGITPQSLPDGARRATLAQPRRDVAVGGGAAGWDRAHCLVDLPVELARARQVERDACQVLRLAREMALVGSQR